jgi:hypothetical protein
MVNYVPLWKTPPDPSGDFDGTYDLSTVAIVEKALHPVSRTR